MSMEERLNKLENKVNIISNDFETIKENINILTGKIEKVNEVSLKLDTILNLMKDKNKKNNVFKKEDNNPFLDEAKVEEEEMVCEEDSKEKENSKDMSISQNSKIDNIKIVKKKRKKYKPRNPLYYYYSIDTKTYKYTCKNKNRKQILDFRRSDSNCQAQGIFYRKDDYFKPNIFTKHIPYEEHSYIISKEFSEKYQNNVITENYFNNDKKNSLLDNILKFYLMMLLI